MCSGKNDRFYGIFYIFNRFIMYLMFLGKCVIICKNGDAVPKLPTYCLITYACRCSGHIMYYVRHEQLQGGIATPTSNILVYCTEHPCRITCTSGHTQNKYCFTKSNVHALYNLYNTYSIGRYFTASTPDC